MFRCVLAALALFSIIIPACGFGQDESPQDEAKRAAGPPEVLRPFLWQTDTDPPSYLFGTIHVQDERVIAMHPLAREAYENAASFYAEIDFVKDAMAQLTAMTLPSNQKIEDLIPKEILNRIDTKLAEINPILNRAALPAIKVAAWPLFLPNLEAQLKNPGAQVLDMKLFTDAQAKGKTVGGLEKPKDQFSGLEALTNDEQVAFLKATLDSMDEIEGEGKDPLNELLLLYLQGEVEPIEVYLRDEMATGLPEELSQKILEALLDQRNERMAKAILKVLKESPDESHFFGVGTAHLIGDKTVQFYLEKEGLKSKRVEPVKVEAGGK